MKKAFTLAETLITLAIIGTIAVLMYSNVVRVRPDENAMLYKKAYFAIQEVISSLANDRGLYPDDDQVFLFEEEGRRRGLCRNVAENLNTIGVVSCASRKAVPTDANFTPDFTISNGASFAGFNQDFAGRNDGRFIKEHVDICVDVNGAKAPNVGCAGDANPNRDRFRIRIEFDGKISTDANWTQENAILSNTGVVTR